MLIDGGIGQLHSAAAALESIGVINQPLASVAKKEEIVYVQAKTAPIKMARNNEALRLLQQVRDESHRFAQHYHHILRSKRTFDEDIKQGRRPPRSKKKRN